jgi:hypothetical protein
MTLFSAMPHNAALVIKSEKTKYILDFNREHKHFFSMLSISQEKETNSLLNTVLSKDKYQKILQNTTFYVSLHTKDESNEELLFALETSRYYNKALLDFLDLIRSDFKEKTFSYKEKPIYALQIDNKLLYMYHQNGLILMTYSETLIRHVINKVVAKNDAQKNLVNSFPTNRNENATMYLYVYYRYFIPYLKQKIRETGGDMLVTDMFASFQYSIFDLSVNDRDVFLSGYTSVDTSLKGKSILFTHQNNELDFFNLLPVNANRIFSIKANKTDDFMRIKPLIQSADDVFSWTYPSRIVTFEIENDTAIDKLLLIKSENISETSFHLYHSVLSSFADNHYILDTTQVGSIMIGHIKMANFVFARLGISNHLRQLDYYAIIDDCILFANKKECLLNCIDALKNRRTLKTSTSCQSLDNYFPPKANLFYYYNFMDRTQSNIENTCLQYYRNNIQLMRVQFHAQSDTILFSNIVFRMQ